MRVIYGNEKSGGRVVALGTFDGVHRGHQALLTTAKAYSREHGIPLRVYTFDRHPLDVIAPEHAPQILTTLPEKMSRMCRFGVDELQLVRFDREMAEQVRRAKEARGSEQSMHGQSADLMDFEEPSEFTGYTDTSSVGTVLAMFKDGVRVKELTDTGDVILSKTCFYAESGGQCAEFLKERALRQR